MGCRRPCVVICAGRIGHVGLSSDTSQYFDAEDELPESPMSDGGIPHFTDALSAAWQSTWRHNKSHSHVRKATAERVILYLVSKGQD